MCMQKQWTSCAALESRPSHLLFHLFTGSTVNISIHVHTETPSRSGKCGACQRRRFSRQFKWHFHFGETQQLAGVRQLPVHLKGKPRRGNSEPSPWSQTNETEQIIVVTVIHYYPQPHHCFKLEVSAQDRNTQVFFFSIMNLPFVFFLNNGCWIHRAVATKRHIYCNVSMEDLNGTNETSADFFFFTRMGSLCLRYVCFVRPQRVRTADRHRAALKMLIFQG